MQQKKGDALERAIKLVEQAIFKYSSTIEPEKFTIENKKIVIIEDVKHEIDLYVEVDISDGYQSVFIFECKNWEDNVDKNEIIVFSEKIRAVSAQKGFFVARRFSKYAIAQAARDKRIEILLASHFPLDIYPFGRMLVTGRSSFDGLVQCVKRSALGLSNATSIAIDVTMASVKLDGDKLDMSKLLDEESSQLFGEALEQINTANLDAGIYPLHLSKTKTFAENRLIINGDDIAELRLDVSVSLIVHRPRIIYHFDIEGRGRYIELESYNYGTGHGELIIALAAPSNKNFDVQDAIKHGQ